MRENEKMESFIRFVDCLPLPVKGILKYRVFKGGKLVEDVENENLIVNGSKELMAHLLAGEIDGRYITKIAFGEGGDVPDVTNSALINPYTKNISGHSFPSLGKVRFDWQLNINEANGKAIKEFGLISDNGTLFSRRIRKNSSPIIKEDDISLEGTWEIIF